MEQEQPNYYAVIPANVRYDKELTANAKLLYGEITALSNDKGYCWASNSYFAKLYNVTEQGIIKWINQLIKKGYLQREVIYKENTKQILGRYLTIVYESGKQMFSRGSKQMFSDNNTNNNTTRNNNTNNKEKELKENAENLLKTFSNEMQEKVNLWLEYKKEKKQAYKPIGLNNLIKTIDKNIKEFGEQTVINAIDNSINNNYAGIFIKKQTTTYQPPIKKGDGSAYANLRER